MKIPVLGMDPSLTNWGLAAAKLDLDDGCLDTPRLELVRPVEIKTKQVRKNSKDLHRTEQLASSVLPEASKATVIFVECPVGSKSARAMASYGVCVGILGVLRHLEYTLIEVTPSEVKKALTGDPMATKAEMIGAAMRLYPDADFPMHRGKVASKAEHLADAIGAIHAGVRTPAFTSLMKLWKQVS